MQNYTNSKSMNPIFSFFLALTAVLAATSNAGGQIYDIDGDFIFDGSYYVLPFFRLPWTDEGGLTLYHGPNQLCPLGIVQASSQVDNGIPVKFSNWLSRVGFVPESANLNIQMDVGVTICRQSAYWWVDEFDTKRKKWFIVAGRKPEVGEDSLKSFFQIQRVKLGDLIADTYKFVYCPAPGKCFNVGMFRDEHRIWRLAISSEPFLVIFKKANVTMIEGSSKIM